MRIQIFLIAFLILSASAAFAQTKKLKWSNEFCIFESTYNAKKYTVAQLEDTRKLLYFGFFPSTIDPTPRNFADVKKLRVETLDAEYKQRVDELKRLNVVKIAYWETLRQKYLKSLEQIYQLSRASILGYQNPTRLRDVKFAGACVEKYADLLIKGGDDLFAAWLSVNEDSRKRNASPERVKARFDEESRSPERLQYAQTEVMAFGWWNCVNAQIDREFDNPQIEKEYKKLFIKTRQIECDEP